MAWRRSSARSWPGWPRPRRTQRETLEKQLHPILAFLVPFFFVVTGTRVVLAELGTLPALGALLVVTLLAIIGKLVGGGLGALSLGRTNALIVGMGMVPRGEVGIIIANLGWQAGVLDGQMYAILIAMSLLTAIIAPSVLPLLLKPKTKTAEPPAEGARRRRAHTEYPSLWGEAGGGPLHPEEERRLRSSSEAMPWYLYGQPCDILLWEEAEGGLGDDYWGVERARTALGEKEPESGKLVENHPEVVPPNSRGASPYFALCDQLHYTFLFAKSCVRLLTRRISSRRPGYQKRA